MIQTDRLNGIRSQSRTSPTWRCVQHSLDKAVAGRKANGETGVLLFVRAAAFASICFLFSTLLFSPAFAAGIKPEPINIAAAASLRTIWTALLEQLPADIDASNLRISFASTGLLQVQIENGAPFDLFLAADRISPDRLREKDLTKGASEPYASGRLVLVTKELKTLTLNDAVADLNKQRQSSQPVRLAIANPRHAPYGRAAREWLASQSLWPWPGSALLLGENTAQTLQFVQSDAVDYALLPAALAGPVKASLKIMELSESDYELIDHHLVVMRHAAPLAEVIANWLQSPAAQSVFALYGLELVAP